MRTQLPLCVFLLLMFMTSISITNGQETLTPLRTVTILPSGDKPTYNCGSSSGTITSVQWLINGTPLEDLDLTNVVTVFSELSGQGTLVFRDVSVEPHNNTIIQCRATFNDGETVDSNNSTLLVQGLLSAVDSLTATPVPLDSIIFLTWTPPFSLDITNVDPDITGYCVGVAYPTPSLVIHSECGITDTQYNSTVSPNNRVCDTYTFTITPVNVVGNGTSASVTRGILQSESTIQDEDFIIKFVQNGSNLSFTFIVSAPVCSGSVSLQDSSYILGPIKVTPDNQDNSISFMIPGSRRNLNRFYNATFTLVNSAGSTTSNISNISTHDVQDTTYNIQDEPVTVDIDYIKNTEALGALLVLMYLDQDGNIVCDQSIYAGIRRSEDDFTLPMGDPAITNTYMELTYDIERNGLEDEAYPAVTKHVSIRNEMLGSSDDFSSCTVTYMSGTASVSCVNSTYQVILLLKNEPYSVIVVNVTSGEQHTTVPLPTHHGRYCIIELPMENNLNSEIKYSREFIVEDNVTQSSTINVVEIVNDVDVIGIAIGVVVLLLSTILIVSIIVVCVATIKMKKKNWKFVMSERNDYEAPPPGISVHMEDQPPIYTLVMPASLRQEPAPQPQDPSHELLIDIEAPPPVPPQDLSDEPHIEAPPPIPSQDISDEPHLETPPPLPLCITEVPSPFLPSHYPPEEPENKVYDVVKENSIGQVAMNLYKGKAKDADLVYWDIHTGPEPEMSPPNVEVTGSRNVHGQNYSLVLLPQPSFKHDGDETTVIYSELKTKEATQVKKELATESGEEVKEALVTRSGEEVKEGPASESGEEEKEGLATESGEEEKEGLAIGNGEEEKEGLAIGNGEEEKEGPATESGEEGLAIGNGEEEKEGLAIGNGEEEKEGLADNDVREATSDIEPACPINLIEKRVLDLSDQLRLKTA